MTRSEADETVARLADQVVWVETVDRSALPGLVGGALAEIELLSRGQHRSRLAEGLVRSLLRRTDKAEIPEMRYLGRLVEIGDEHLPDRPDWPRVRAVARCMALTRATIGHEIVDYRAAMDEVDGFITEFADDPMVSPLAALAQAALGAAADPGEVAALRASWTELGRYATDAAAMIELMLGVTDAVQASENGDVSAVATLPGLKAGLQEVRSGYFAGAVQTVAPLLDLLPSILDAAPEVDQVAFDRSLDALQNLADRPGITPTERAQYLVLLGGARLRQGEEREPARIARGIADLRTAISLTPDGHPDRVLQLDLLAWAVARQTEVGGSTGGVEEAVALLEQARELAGGPEHPYWSAVNGTLATLRRKRGDDNSLSRRTAFEGLRGHAWQVLLQPDTLSVRSAARDALENAMAVAARFLADEEPADALRALDAGRGLMLFAATELRDPCTRLIEAGRPELAQRWRAERHPPAWLRQDVLEVLSAGTGLLDPPDLGEIQAALRTLDVDALVYLVPAVPPSPGWAVIAPAEGPPRYLSLPNLVIQDSADVERYLAALATRGAASAGARDLISEHAEFADSIDALCEWAWRAAMGPIVRPYLDAGRVPHLVLIPMGDLARVPWQAARRPDGRYLVEQVALSQAASARMLCESAAAEPVRLTSAGLVVADPDAGDRAASLPSARLEAYAIRESFYPCATYLGRLPNGMTSRSGAGTPDDLRAWLRADGAQAGAMLHLASHGIMETAIGSASSRLVLAGGDLAADELIGIRTGSEQLHPLGLVVLAACHTGRSVHGYDEAYSLATMFLAAGARSVLSTQWSIPDQDTSLLMYMFHHYMASECLPPWDALRRAQAWMLDEARIAPGNMPERLRRMTEGPDPARVLAWAGFIHWGQ
ncbi:MAG: CHAT domain-containing protein [Jatrophihabitantaceae bacterium]